MGMKNGYLAKASWNCSQHLQDSDWVCCQVQKYLWLPVTMQQCSDSVHSDLQSQLISQQHASPRPKACSYHSPMLHCVYPCHIAIHQQPPPLPSPPHLATVFDMHVLNCRWQQTRWSQRRTSSGRASCATTGSTMKLPRQGSLPRSVHHPPSLLALVVALPVCCERRLAPLLCCSS